MEKEIIYVIGHKSPDTDTVCSAIAYSSFLKKQKINAIPAYYGELNPETEYALDLFKVKDLLNLKSVKGKSVVLVDHNEAIQSPDGIEDSKVVEIVDHHKIGFSSSDPIAFIARPYGSTATIIAERMFLEQFKITKQIAGLLLCAILSDTIVFKSTTTTKTDMKIAKELAVIAGVTNLKIFGIELKKKKASLSGLSAEKILYSDFKLFEASDKKFGIGQIEVVDLKEGKERKEDIIKKLGEIVEKDGLSFGVLMMTDIIKEGSELIIVGDIKPIEKAFKVKIKDNSIYIPGMMSRKKDLVPKLM
ncbi:MAG: manganese-dependent inorganic pyrophosphatase [Candidatus Pacebacteria bacterium]|nr:manganese-dependent inorganic pyrophosphatase [Candidatus Paceibacterota bacterium]